MPKVNEVRAQAYNELMRDLETALEKASIGLSLRDSLEIMLTFIAAHCSLLGMDRRRFTKLARAIYGDAETAVGVVMRRPDAN